MFNTGMMLSVLCLKLHSSLVIVLSQYMYIQLLCCKMMTSLWNIAPCNLSEVNPAFQRYVLP